MITEDYINFETAKLLKEKGFDEKCDKVYLYNGKCIWAQNFMEGESFVNNKDIELVADYNDWITYTQGEYAYLCPTLQTACKWLREEKKLVISVDLNYSDNSYSYSIDSIIEHRILGYGLGETYEEAVEAAIKYCLENLI